MKKLGIFLWLIVFAFASYISYAIFYNENIREQDLREVIQMEQSIQNINSHRKDWAYREWLEFTNMIYLTGNQPKELGFLKKIEQVGKLMNPLDSVLEIKKKDMALSMAWKHQEDFCTQTKQTFDKIAALDTVFIPYVTIPFPKPLHFSNGVFYKIYLSHYQFVIQDKIVNLQDRKIYYMGCWLICFPTFLGKAFSPQLLWYENEMYHASIVFTHYKESSFLRCVSFVPQTAEKVKAYNQYEDLYIEPIAKSLFSPKELRAVIKVKRANQTDTTFTVTTTYTIKPKRK